MLKELQTLDDLGYRGHVDVVDDNFIGSKKLVKEFLPHLRTWLEARNWPFEFTTEASINLADDPVLMRMMRDVGFFAVFIGIESPDESTLIGMQKLQNTRRSIVERPQNLCARHVRKRGVHTRVRCREGRCRPRHIECIEDGGIPVSMAGLLVALPMTQLTRRLAEEGRLHEGFDLAPEGGDQCTAGLNFDTCRPRADILEDYLKVIETIYAPENYFNRVLKVGLMLDSSERRHKPAPRRHLKEMKAFWRMTMKLGLPRNTRRHLLSALINAVLKNPRSIRYTGSLMALYLHFGPFAEYVASRTRDAITKERFVPSKVAVRPAQPARLSKAASAE